MNYSIPVTKPNRLMEHSTKATKLSADAVANAAWLDVVRQQVSSLRFGVVQIIVHEASVVQIERTEKLRLDRPSDKH